MLNYIGQSGPIEGLTPASYLIATADGLDLILAAPPSLKMGPRAVLDSDVALGIGTGSASFRVKAVLLSRFFPPLC